MFDRKPLRADVQKEIRERILDGRLPAETRLNEAHLSQDLGISRTPLREAMLGLEAAGFLLSEMGRGFRVPPLAAAEFRDLGAVLARLEGLALESSPLPSPSRLMEMQNLLGRTGMRTNTAGPEAALAMAHLLPTWAGLVFAGCPNVVLRDEILRLEARTARCWGAAVLGGFPPLEVLAVLEELYTMMRGQQRTAVATAWPDNLFGLVDRAAAVLP